MTMTMKTEIFVIHKVYFLKFLKGTTTFFIT